MTVTLGWLGVATVRLIIDDLVALIREELSRQAPAVELVEMGYMEAYPILRGIR